MTQNKSVLNPRFEFDKVYHEKFPIISGTDEAGRGAWAGPIVVASVILPIDYNNNQIRDSKKISPQQREKLFLEIKKVAIDYSIAILSHRVVDEKNPKYTSQIGMISTLTDLKVAPDIALIDGEKILLPSIPTIQLIKGDDLSQSIGAASILAKVTRDHLMVDFDNYFPNYDFKNNKGYGTKNHAKGLNTFGVCKIHRLSYKPVQKLLKK